MARKQQAKKPPKVAKRPTILLKPRTYDKLERLVFWAEATPDDLDLGDHTWDDIHTKMNDYLTGHLGPEECATVEVGRSHLVAVVEDAQGVEHRVRVEPADLQQRIERHRAAQRGNK